MVEHPGSSDATHESKIGAAIAKAKAKESGVKTSIKESIEKSEGNFHFPCGVIVGDKRNTLFSVSPLTGATRRRITAPDIRRSGTRAVTVLLLDCLKQIEGVGIITEKTVNSLVACDRDFAALMIRKEALGNEMRMNIQCPDCKEKLDTDIIIDELECTPYDENNICVENGNFIVNIASKELGFSARLRIANGYDQAKLGNLLQKNPVDAGLKLIQNCLVEYNDNKEFDKNLVESLDVKNIDYIDSELAKAIPGVNLYPTIECEMCGKKVRVSMDVADFLFKRPAGM